MHARGTAWIVTAAGVIGLALFVLTPRGSPSQPLPLQQKLQELEERLSSWLAAGGDPTVVMPMGRKLDELLKTGTPAEVEAQVDRILVVVATTPTPSARAKRLNGLQARINAWLAKGGDPAQVVPLGQHLDELLKTGTAAEVDAQMDKILAVVSATPRTPQRGARLSGLQQQIDEWLAAGGDPAKVLPMGQKLDSLLASGTPEQIDAQIDRIRRLIATVPTPAPRANARPRAIDVRPIPPGAAIIFWSVRYDPTRRGPTLGPSELYTMDAQGGAVTQITYNNPQAYEHAAVSCDRKMIAADRYLRSGTGPAGLWLIDIARKTEARLVPGFFSAGDGGVDWDSKGLIYFAGRPAVNRKAGVFRIRPNGSGLEQLVVLDPSDGGFVGDVSVSEDGSLLAYVRARAVPQGGRQVLKTQIWVARVDGTGQRMVDDGGPEFGNYGGFPIGDFDPELSPDNRFVVFSRTNTHFVNFKDSLHTAHDLWVAALDGSRPARRITVPGPISIIPDWHDGRILYTEYDERGNYIGLVTVAPDGTDKRRLEHHLQNVWAGGRHGKWIPGA